MAYINVDEVYILDNTGLQVDMATDIPFVDAGFTDTQKEQARKNIGAGGTNPNLLDNWYFIGGGTSGTFPINQRGNASYSTSGHCIDRWDLGNNAGTLTLNANYATFASGGSNIYLQQKLATPVEGTYTLSARVNCTGRVRLVISDASMNTLLSDYYDLTGEEIITLTFTTSGTPIGAVRLRCDSNVSANWYAAKLEKGANSTLANDAPPNYAEELDKCLYYFERIKAVTNLGLGTGIGNGTRFYAPLSIHPKRANPTISYTGTISIGRSAVETTITGIYTSGTECDYASGHIQLGVTVTNTSGTPYRLILEAGGTLDFSADL